MKWFVGGVVAAIAAWAVLNISPVDLMTPECRALAIKTKADNDQLRLDLGIVQHGGVVNGARGAAALKHIEMRQRVINDNLAFIERSCK